MPSSTTHLSAVAGTTAFAATAVFAASAASAGVSSISIHTAGTKSVGVATNVWGTVQGGAGVKACTQVLVNGTWAASQCATTTSSGSYAIELTYGKTTPGTYTFRVTAGGKVGPAATLTRTGAASGTQPGRPAPRTPAWTSGPTLRPTSSTYVGDNGVKVYLVQKALGLNPQSMDSALGPRYLGHGRYTSMWRTTITRLEAFQRAHGIHADAVIDDETFYTLKADAPNKSVLSGYNFDVDVLKQRSTVTANASHNQRVAAMITWARQQDGKPYVWGGTGPMGYDCSGLLLQALRAGGYDPKNAKVDNLTDVRGTSQLSQAMHDDSEFPKVSLSKLQPGDFIYYGNSTGVHHVSMFIGNNEVINSVDDRVKISPLSENFGLTKVGANRMP